MSDFNVTSESFNDGDAIGMDHILSEEYGFGCSGGNKSPQLSCPMDCSMWPWCVMFQRP